MPDIPTESPMPAATDTSAGKSVPFYSAATYRPEDSVGYLMRRILGLVVQQSGRCTMGEGPSYSQWVPLFKLYLGGPRPAAELARGCMLDAGAMTRTIDRMVEKGWCQRERSTQDRRVINISLTAAGREVASHIPETLAAIHNATLEGFSREEFETLRGMLHRMLGNLERMASSDETRKTSPDAHGDVQTS